MTFNTLILPASARLDAVNVIAHDVLGHRFAPQGNASIEDAVAPDARSYIKDKHCDCGMGLAERRSDAKRAPLEREIRKLRAAGWGEAKIERWLAQRASTQQKDDEQRDRAHHAKLAQAERWATFVRRLLDERLAPWAGLFTHAYQGSVDKERIPIAGVRRFIGANADVVGVIEEDTPFVFAAA